MRFSYKTQAADPLRPSGHAPGSLIGCNERGDLALSDEPRRSYYNYTEWCSYEIEGNALKACPRPNGAVAGLTVAPPDSERDLGAARRELYFASASEAVVGPAPGVERETHVVVPWPCRVHPHTLQYARAHGNGLRTGAVRAAGWHETRMALDGPPLAWEWLDGDGLCAATETSVHVLFTDAERLSWWDLLAETILFRVPIAALAVWILLENQMA